AGLETGAVGVGVEATGPLDDAHAQLVGCLVRHALQSASRRHAVHPGCETGRVSLDLTAAGFCGVILAGGTAARLGGADKASIELGGRTLLEIAIDAFLDADEVVVVGPETVRTTRPVTFVREDPPLGGPVVGLLAGVESLLRRPRTIR